MCSNNTLSILGTQEILDTNELKKAIIEEAASASGKSVNQFINDLIDEKINGK